MRCTPDERKAFLEHAGIDDAEPFVVTTQHRQMRVPLRCIDGLRAVAQATAWGQNLTIWGVVRTTRDAGSRRRTGCFGAGELVRRLVQVAGLTVALDLGTDAVPAVEWARRAARAGNVYVHVLCPALRFSEVRTAFAAQPGVAFLRTWGHVGGALILHDDEPPACPVDIPEPEPSEPVLDVAAPPLQLAPPSAPEPQGTVEAGFGDAPDDAPTTPDAKRRQTEESVPPSPEPTAAPQQPARDDVVYAD